MNLTTPLQILAGFLGILFMLFFVGYWRADDGMLILFEWAAVCLIIGLAPGKDQMKRTKPLLKTGYVPSWRQAPNYLAKRFTAIEKRQREEKERESAAAIERILKVKAIR